MLAHQNCEWGSPHEFLSSPTKIPRLHREESLTQYFVVGPRNLSPKRILRSIVVTNNILMVSHCPLNTLLVPQPSIESSQDSAQLHFQAFFSHILLEDLLLPIKWGGNTFLIMLLKGLEMRCTPIRCALWGSIDSIHGRCPMNSHQNEGRNNEVTCFKMNE